MLLEELIGIVLGCSVVSQAAIGIQAIRMQARLERIERNTAIAVTQVKATAEFIEIKVDRLETMILRTYRIEHPSHPEYDSDGETGELRNKSGAPG